MTTEEETQGVNEKSILERNLYQGVRLTSCQTSEEMILISQLSMAMREMMILLIEFRIRGEHYQELEMNIEFR